MARVDLNQNVIADWRAELPPVTRRRNVREIYDLLIRNIPLYEPDGAADFHKIATCFEEKFYNTATSLADYSSKVSAKLQSMRMKVNRANQAAQNPNYMDQDRTELQNSEMSGAPAASEDSSSQASS
ncbi:hypothetical protein LUZ60_012213 [Juncus effusus]|nr:hypothetical protein LUZ60_012213 [Juncus effusus]